MNLGLFTTRRLLGILLAGLSCLGLFGCGADSQQPNVTTRIVSSQVLYAQAVIPPAEDIGEKWQVADQFIATRMPHSKLVQLDQGKITVPEIRPNTKKLLTKSSECIIYAGVAYAANIESSEAAMRSALLVQYYYAQYPAEALKPNDELPTKHDTKWIRGEDGIAQGLGQNRSPAEKKSANDADNATAKKKIKPTPEPELELEGKQGVKIETAENVNPNAVASAPPTPVDGKNIEADTDVDVIIAVELPDTRTDIRQPIGKKENKPEAEATAKTLTAKSGEAMVAPENAPPAPVGVAVNVAKSPQHVYLAARGVLVDIQSKGTMPEAQFIAAVSTIRNRLSASLEAERRFREQLQGEREARAKGEIDMNEKIHPVTERVWKLLYIVPGGELYNKSF